MPYIVAAEVNKIQSFIQRSVRLKELVGASYMLVDFCAGIKRKYEAQGATVLTSAGGNFRLEFPDRKAALDAAAYLRQEFEHEIGGTLTIIEPRDSLAEAESALKELKQRGESPAPLWHLPYQALCQSCGIEPAHIFDRYHEDDPARYLCASCARKSRKAEEERRVLWKELTEVVRRELNDNGVSPYESPYEAETYAEYDTKQRVAYLVADGNRMGEYFGKCKPSMRPILSAKVDEVNNEALGQAIAKVMRTNGEWRIPLLPLIMGGDDIFVLIPAPYALAIVQKYMQVYQDRMTAFLRNTPDLWAETVTLPATVGVGILVCKASYPHRAAHQAGEDLMSVAKFAAKTYEESMVSISMAGLRSPTNTYSNASVEEILKHRQLLNPVAATTRNRLRDLLATRASTDAVMNRVKERSGLEHDLLHTARSALGDAQFLDLLELWDFCLGLEVAL